MKKILAIVFALMLLLTACSGSGDVPAGTVSQTPDVTEATSGSTPETEAPAEETEAPSEEAEVSLGRMEGGIYTNSYVGYSCELDSSWSFYTAEELQEIPGNVAEVLNGSELDSDTILNQITDMMAENVNDLTTINILYTKLSMAERLTYSVMTEEEIMDLTLEQKDVMIDAYQQAGFVVESMEKVKVTFLGQERTGLFTACTIDEIPYYTLQIFDYQLGQYGVTTTFASYLDDNTAALLELFHAID